MMKIFENKYKKILTSKDYHYFFDKQTGFNARWGETREEDPKFSPYGPEIADIEIGTSCDGIQEKPCDFCYKGNILKGKNMSLETFKKVFKRLPRTIQQIAFGIGSINENKELFIILEYCRNNDYQEVIPNITINGAHMNTDYYDRLIELCGAIAVSRYSPQNVCYEAVEELTNRDHKQINIHQLVCQETFNDCLNVIDDIKNDQRLGKLNAIVFLSLKKKGRGTNYHTLGQKEYNYLVKRCLDSEISFGFDSCSAPKFLESVKDHPKYVDFLEKSEPCESSLFSIYVNVDGELLPCSFMGGEWNKPQSLLKNDFMSIWQSEELNKFRNDLLLTEDNNICRICPKFEV